MRFIAWFLALAVFGAYLPGCVYNEHDHHWHWHHHDDDHHDDHHDWH